MIVKLDEELRVIWNGDWLQVRYKGATCYIQNELYRLIDVGYVFIETMCPLFLFEYLSSQGERVLNLYSHPAYKMRAMDKELRKTSSWFNDGGSSGSLLGNLQSTEK